MGSKMNCAGLEGRLQKLQDDSLAPEEERAVREHLSSCASCRELVQLFSGSLNLPSFRLPAGLAESILERTSGRACGRVREHLCDFVDGRLESSYGDLLSVHVENCPDCSALAAGLTELRETLPRMAEINPGMGFTRRVLLATSRRLPESRFKPWMRLWQSWVRLLQRPRFSWEAAYLGTILLVSVLGNPFTTLQDLSLRAREIFSSEASFSWVSMALPGSLIQSETGTLRHLRELAERSAARQLELSRSAARLFQQGALSIRYKVQHDLEATRSLPDWAASIFKRTRAKISRAHSDPRK